LGFNLNRDKEGKSFLDLRKLTVLKNHHGKSFGDSTAQQSDEDPMKIPEENLIIVFVVARPLKMRFAERLTLIVNPKPINALSLPSPQDEAEQKGKDERVTPLTRPFRGTILISDRSKLMKHYGTPFNNMGIFLNDYERMIEEKGKRKGKTDSSP